MVILAAMKTSSIVGLSVLAVLLLQVNVVWLHPEPYHDPAAVGRKQSFTGTQEQAFARTMKRPYNPEPYHYPAAVGRKQSFTGTQEQAFARTMKRPYNPEPYHDPAAVGRKQSFTGTQEQAFARTMKKPYNPEPYYEPAGVGRMQTFREPAFAQTMKEPTTQAKPVNIADGYHRMTTAAGWRGKEPSNEGREQLLAKMMNDPKIARILKDPAIARMMMSYIRMNKPALSQQDCDTTPVCAFPSTLDSQGCRCMTLTNDVSCPTGYFRSFSDGQCVCATVIQMQCDSPGFRFSQANNCQCVLETNTEEKREPICPSGSFRPEGTCYCAVVQDPSCPGSGNVTTDNKCSCIGVEQSTPTCSNPNICSLDEQACACS